MPDQFGNPTPQEVLANIHANARGNFLQGQQSSSPGVQLGASLGAIFGRPVRKFLDTRQARRAETDRLVRTEGISEEAAREQARINIEPQFAQVRQAQRIQEAQSSMHEFMEGLDQTIPEDMRRAQGMLFLSNRMRSMGMTAQANQLATQASQEMQAARQRALEVEKLEADIDNTQVNTERTRAEIPFVGTTAFQQMVIRTEQITGMLNDPNSQMPQDERESLMRERGWLQAKLIKDTAITGTTAEDMRRDSALLRQNFNELADNQMLLNSINDTDALLDDLDNFEATFWAGVGVDFLGFAENFFGRTPTESEQEFMTRVTQREAMPTLIAAKIRHALTGAQMSAFEIVYLRPFLPSPEDSVQEVRAKLNVIRWYTQLDIDTRRAVFQQDVLEEAAEASGARGFGQQGASSTSSDTSPEGTARNSLEAAIAEREAQQ